MYIQIYSDHWKQKTDEHWKYLSRQSGGDGWGERRRRGVNLGRRPCHPKPDVTLVLGWWFCSRQLDLFDRYGT